MQKDRSSDITTIRPDTSAHSIDTLRALDPELPDFAWHIITGYSPISAGPGWLVVRELVIQAVLSVRPRTHVNTRRLMTMTGLFATWVWTRTGTEPVAHRIFTNTNVHRYLHDRLGTHSAEYRFDTARQLSAIAEALLGTVVDRLPTPRQSGRIAPYTPSDIAVLHSWASNQSTDLSRSNARALLGLAGGAGLTAQELMAAHVEDLDNDGRYLFIDVRGTQARRVPVLHKWAKTLKLAVGDRVSGPIFRGFRLHEYPPRILQTFISDHPCRVRPSARRLNNTWIVTQLDAGIPLQLLLELTGHTTTQAIRPYLQYARPVEIEQYLDRITGIEAV